MPFQRKVGNDSLLIYACIDRITGEEVPFLIQMLMDAGARNANIVQAYGKKIGQYSSVSSMSKRVKKKAY